MRGTAVTMKNQADHVAESMRRTVVRQSLGTLSRKRLTDHIRPGVRILFVGINPSLRSAATGHHFAGYSNRFWRLLFESKLLSEPLTYQDDWRLPDWGLGLTNIIQRPSAGIDVLKPSEYASRTEEAYCHSTTLSPSRGRPARCHDLPHVIPRVPDRTTSASGCKPRPWPTALFLSCPIPAVGMPIIHIGQCSRRSVHCAM